MSYNVVSSPLHTVSYVYLRRWCETYKVYEIMRFAHIYIIYTIFNKEM